MNLFPSQRVLVTREEEWFERTLEMCWSHQLRQLFNLKLESLNILLDDEDAKQHGMLCRDECEDPLHCYSSIAILAGDLTYLREYLLS